MQNGPLHGLVFSSKEKKVKRLCFEALKLAERLNDVHLNTLPWHELQAWRSDAENTVTAIGRKVGSTMTKGL